MPARLPDSLRLGPVRLAVSDLARSLAYYQDALGLRVHSRDEQTAAVGDGTETVLVLVEEPGARPPGRHAGLFHYALLYPSREELARAAVRLGRAGAAIDGASDHGTHEAFYLSDPDGNGIELAADRPRERWPDVRSISGYAGGPRPLDVRDLLATAPGEPPRHVGEGLRMGHLHLHVGDVEEGLRFYRDVVGFEEMVNLGSAAFVSAGGYHHHLGFNVWAGRGVGPPPPGTVGLRWWTVELPDAAAVGSVRERVVAAGNGIDEEVDGFVVRDPWGTALRFAVAAPASSVADVASGAGSASER